MQAPKRTRIPIIFRIDYRLVLLLIALVWLMLAVILVFSPPDPDDSKAAALVMSTFGIILATIALTVFFIRLKNPDERSKRLDVLNGILLIVPMTTPLALYHFLFLNRGQTIWGMLSSHLSQSTLDLLFPF